MWRNGRSFLVVGFASVMMFFACDLSSPDILTPDTTMSVLQAKMFVRAGSSVVMDFTPFVSSSTLISISKDAKTGTINFVDGKFLRYMPNPYLPEGTDDFVININDTEVAINVVIMSTTNPNPPCAAGAMSDKTISNINTPVTVDVLANDQFCGGADLSTFKIITQPKNGQLKISGSKLTFTPNTNFVGIDEAIYEVNSNDGSVKNSSAEVFFNVVDPNICAIKINAIETIKWTPTDANPSLSIDLAANNTLCKLSLDEILIGNPPKNGSVEIVNKKIVYTPKNKSNFSSDIFSFGIKDVSGVVYNGNIEIINPLGSCIVNLMPDNVSFAPTASVTSIIIDVLANDTLCGILPNTLAISKKPTNGEAYINFDLKSGYIPKAGFKGTDFYYYTVSDASGFMYTGVVKVKVN